MSGHSKEDREDAIKGVKKNEKIANLTGGHDEGDREKQALKARNNAKSHEILGKDDKPLSKTDLVAVRKTLEIHKEQLLQLNGFNVNYTWAWLQKKIDDYVGDAEYTLALDIQNFTLIVSTPNASSTWANQVTWLIDKTLPSNIAYFFQIRSDNDYITTLANTWSKTYYQY